MDLRASLKITEETRTRLTKRMKYGDTYDSAIIELLDLADKVEGKPPPKVIPEQLKPETSKPVVESRDKPENIVEKW